MWKFQRANRPSKNHWYGSGANNRPSAMGRKYNPIGLTKSKEKHPSVIMYEYLKKNGHPEP